MKPSHKKTIKLAIYTVICLFLFLLQTVPNPLIRIGVLRAEYLIPFCVALTLFDSAKTGAGFGLFGGLLLDMDSPLLFGLSALFLLLVLYFAGEWIRTRLFKNLRNAIWLSASLIIIYYLFIYTLTRLFLPGGTLLTGFLDYALPTALISLPGIIIVNWIIRGLARRLVPEEINLTRS